MIDSTKNLKLTNLVDIIMKTIRITLIVFFLPVIFACNNQQSKKAEGNNSIVNKSISEKPVNKSKDTILGQPITKKINKTGQKDIKPCENLITEILTTSPRYKQLTKGLNKAVVKNGGQYFGVSLEKSPDPKHDKAYGYSKTFDFTIYEMYTDRQLNTARFSFDPNKKQLYEYNIGIGRLKPLEFDKQLLLKYDSLCCCL